MEEVTRISNTGKVLVLVAVCFAGLATAFNFTAAPVALPAIGRGLDASPFALSWVTNIFMLSFGSVVLAMGTIADTYGRRRCFSVGMVGFLLASVGCALAPSISILNAMRALQGLTGALAFAAGSAAMAQEFEGARRVQAFSFIGTSFGMGLSCGPVTGGWLIDALGWRSVFLFVALLSAAATLLGLLFLRESRDPSAAKLDWLGAISFTAMLGLFTYALLLIPELGWDGTTVLFLLVATILLLATFIIIELRVAQPMLDLTLFRYPAFVGVQFLAMAPAYSFVVLLMILPSRFVGVERHAESEVGLLMMALSGPLLVVPFLSGTLVRWISPALLSGIGLALAAAGLFWLSSFMTGMPLVVFTPPLLLIGIGIGLPWGIMDGLAVSVVPKERAGMATGIFSTMRGGGEGIALAITTTLLTSLIDSQLVRAGSIDSSHLHQIAQRLVAGDLAAVIKLTPAAAGVVPAFGAAYQSLLQILAWITVASAGVIYFSLRRRQA